MDINKYYEAKILVERIKALAVVCDYAKMPKYTLAFEENSFHCFSVDEALKDDVIKLAKALKDKLEQELKEL